MPFARLPRLSKNTKAVMFIIPAAVYLTLTCLYPLISALKMGFYTEIAGGKNIFVGLSNYIEIFKDPTIWHVMQNSFFFTGFTVLFHLLLGLTFALLLSQKIKYRDFWRGLQFIPWLLPPAVIGALWVLIYDPVIGLFNTTLRQLHLPFLMHDFLGDPKTALSAVTFVNVWSWYPFFTVMLLAGLIGIPADLYEAARLDGAGRWGRFRYVTIPLLKPVILTICLLDAIWTFRFFDLVWIMTEGGPARATEIMPSYVYKTAFYDFDFNMAGAMGGVMVGIMLIFVLVYLKVYFKK